MEGMEKQTAVDWLENEFQEIFKEWGGIDTNWLKRFQQAKAMEKEQIINAFGEGIISGITSTKMNGNEYYNETFKSE